jgi:hypothetical protein
MIFLVDYNLTGYVVLFQGTLAAGGWLDRRTRGAIGGDPEHRIRSNNLP